MIIIVILLVSYIDVTSSSASDSDDEGFKTIPCNRAENMTFGLCISYTPSNTTYLPNFVGHESQLEAVVGFMDFQPFLQVECSPYLEQFLCSVYFPRCVSQVTIAVLPCRDFCQRVRDDCSKAFQTLGAAWPDSLDCEKKFVPDNSENALCMSLHGEPEKDTGSDGEVLTSATVAPDPSGRCQPLIDDPICNEMPYTTVIYPNILGHNNQSDALLELHKYSAFMSIGGPCSELLRTFLCLAYQPPCKIIGDVAVPIPPCQALCELVLTELCLAAVAAFKMEFPATLTDCSFYPKQSDSYPTCFMPGAKYDPLTYWEPPPIVDSIFTEWCAREGCVAVPHSKCNSLGFKMMIFPNLLGHESMEEAMAEMNRLAPLFNSGCSEEMQELMCFAFFFNGTSPANLAQMPCQNVCQQVWKRCRHTAGELLEKRPRIMTCRLYPVENCTSEISTPQEPVTIVQVDRVNFTHAFIEYKSTHSFVVFEKVSPWEMREGHIKHTNHDERRQIYVELEYQYGYHVVFWPFNGHGRGRGPPAATWIPANVDGPYPDHCDANSVMLCSKIGYNMSQHLEEFWQWTPPDELFTTWQNYFTEDTLKSGEGCLPHLHELLCGLLAHRCTQEEFSQISPCQEFCLRVRSECSTPEHGDLTWLVDALPCDYLLTAEEGSCISGRETGQFEVTIIRDKYQYMDESVRVYCTLNEGAPSWYRPEFYSPDGKRLPVTSSNDRSSRRVVMELSPRMSMLAFERVLLEDAGTYTCRAAGGSVSHPVDLKPLVRCVPTFNHTLCAPFSRTGYVQSRNVLGHTSQYQAEVSSYHFLPLLNTRCSPDLLEMICALHDLECRDSMYHDSMRMHAITLPSQRLS